MTAQAISGMPGPEELDWILPLMDSSLAVTGVPDAERGNFNRLWSRCRSMSTDSAPGRVLDASPVTDWARFQERLVYEATAEFIAAGQGTHLMFHAAGLSDLETGESIALIAPSGTGKTTASRELGQHLAYLTDETVAVAADFSIHPYPKPLSVLPSHGRRPKIQVSPDDLGLIPPQSMPRLSRIAVLNRVHPGNGSKPGATYRVLPLLEALERIVPQTSSLSRLPRGLVTLCSAIQRCGGALEINYSEARALPHLIAEILRPDGHRQFQDWSPVELRPSTTAGSHISLDEYERAWIRTTANDAVLIDGVLVVLAGDRLTCLTGIAPRIWEELSAWTTIDQLHDRLVARFGAAPDSMSQLEKVLNNMLELGVVAKPIQTLHESH